MASVPNIFTTWPPIRDELETETSASQDKTVQECLPLHLGSRGSFMGDESQGLPKLDRAKHIRYLHRSLEPLPAVFVGYDASRPWVIYWALTALSLLGEDVAPYRERVTQTFSAMQNVDGGFGGGHGQTSHCAPSYAAVLSLAMVGGTASLDMIDRKALKQMGVSESALMEKKMSGQTFEGGISGSPQTEAHGAYAFCALACLSILGPPQEIIPSYLDVHLLLGWLSARQYAPEGGFAGRTNKLVDGCYSHWVGGCWPLLEAAIEGSRTQSETADSPKGSLYSRDGLMRYILACCQSEKGGLRDKPSHSAQNYNYYRKGHADDASRVLPDALQWASVPHRSTDERENGLETLSANARVTPIHPIYVIPSPAVENTRGYFERKGSF
ncbi:MAG: hypothetical protein Q9213_007946 [Squamulea squamosa]